MSENAGQYKRGQSGNPKGKPIGAGNKAALIRQELLPYAEELVENLIKKMRCDDPNVSLRATVNALDRLYGTPVQSVELTGAGGKDLPIQLIFPSYKPPEK